MHRLFFVSARRFPPVGCRPCRPRHLLTSTRSGRPHASSRSQHSLPNHPPFHFVDGRFHLVNDLDTSVLPSLASSLLSLM